LRGRIGRELVVRHTAGYRLTEFGRELLPFAEHVEAAVKELEQHLADAARDRRGIIRLTCPEPIVPRLMPLIERFHARYPKFQVEFVTSDRYLDLLKGEADVAFRSGDTDDDLIGRKIADSMWAVYASRTYIERHGKPERVEDLAHHLLVSLDESLANHRVVKWLEAVAPDVKIAARNNSVLGLVYAVKSGIGLGPLPTAIADEQEDLVRVLGPIPELARSWRLLTHPDLRHTPRVSAFFDFIVEERTALKAIFTG
jgi:DNA-binding transcriptional LysR family regulator